MIALAGIAAASVAVALGLTNADASEVGIGVFLNDWITLNFIQAWS